MVCPIHFHIMSILMRSFHILSLWYPMHVFFYKNIKNLRSLRMFLNFWTLSLKMFLKCSYFSYFFNILVQFPKKLHVLKSAKPSNVLNMFLIFFDPRSLMFLYSLFLLKKKQKKTCILFGRQNFQRSSN